jgi:hypothetical protein
MSSTTEKKGSHDYPEKDHVLAELGDILATREALSPEEDRRILRRIDMQ